MVSGRFPLRSWPRALNCVLEWQDRNRDWVLRRGDPMVYLMFDFDDPAKRPRMVEAAMTPPLRRHAAQIDNVGSFGRNVRPMFLEAARRRQAGRAAGANRWRFQDQAEGELKRQCPGPPPCPDVSRALSDLMDSGRRLYPFVFK